ncbi:DUF3040 domain-containing protein [Streptomyces sp. NPDC021020]|uniref:DUF3040 domain-containing protein n=1 Tax=Streptomyces sp. NPDC021020 TaxID=3365109 RepID=UPI0037B25705
MVLSLHERRVIADLERLLTRDDPRLSKTLADFGRTRPEPLHPPAPPAPEVEPAPVEPPRAERSGRVTAWASVLALVLLFAALALSAAAQLLAASVCALVGVASWAVYRVGRHRGSGRPPPGSGPGIGPGG